MSEHAWDLKCHEGIEKTIAQFRQKLPNYWYTVGECQVSCDASCGPTSCSDDVKLIPQDERFNSGFHVDVPQPSTTSAALMIIMLEALAARAKCLGNEKEAADCQEACDLLKQGFALRID